MWLLSLCILWNFEDSEPNFAQISWEEKGEGSEIPPPSLHLQQVSWCCYQDTGFIAHWWNCGSAKSRIGFSCKRAAFLPLPGLAGQRGKVFVTLTEGPSVWSGPRLLLLCLGQGRFLLSWKLPQLRDECNKSLGNGPGPRSRPSSKGKPKPLCLRGTNTNEMGFFLALRGKKNHLTEAFSAQLYGKMCLMREFSACFHSFLLQIPFQLQDWFQLNLTDLSRVLHFKAKGNTFPSVEDGGD